MAKVSLPQGTRDFSAAVVRKRRYIFQTIQQVFELFGFEPLETPAMENLDTLMGKYGDEGDKLIFRILNNGLERPEKHDKARADLELVLAGKNVSSLTERALRYDLTIPFARYVAMNNGKLTLPFRRYQMQPVWRADRPQKGRYREFYQCDADIVGSSSLLNEAELANLYATVFAKLGIPVKICVNNRKILAGLADACGSPEKLTDITVAIDKLDKIGIEKVQEELAQRGLNAAQVDLITAYLDIKGEATDMLEKLEQLLPGNALAAAGIDSLNYVLKATQGTAALQPDFTLARGLNYYTGIIFEVKAQGVQIGSIGGGGRYDDLTGLFGVPGIAGVGISFGVDRIFDVMEELQLFPESLHTGTEVLFFNMGAAESLFALPTLMNLRNAGVSCELYHEPAKMDKQFKYAEKKGIPVAVIIGSAEMAAGNCLVKQLATGAQHTLSIAELVAWLKTSTTA
ncbi:MAG: histidine--tRNA ligase [Chitinophagaceae bacterium]|jgi:histidyl-tRNA synthetase|nr:histidine--tRNA ligase [Chitinophagaceae bacterium]